MSGPIHQLVHTLSYGDAISGEVIALQRWFRESGRESEIYALNVHPRYVGAAKDAATFPSDFSGEVVLHYSLGSSLNRLYAGLTRATRSLIYHNITPARWFAGVNPRIVADIERGLAELPELCRLTDRLIADSPFNAGELRALGFDSTVLELPIDTAKWSIPRNQGLFEVAHGEPGVHLLHVGRLAPNKCLEDILRMFWFFHRFVEPRSRLWLVGIDIDTEVYSFALKRLIHELEIDGAVNIVGHLGDDGVKALYEAATVYVCMSEHEGFCLPLVEAMHFGVPVVAFASSAVPETLGGAGVLVREKRHAELAEVVGEVARNGDLRARLIAAGRARVGALGLESFAARVTRLFAEAPATRAAMAG